MSWKVPLFKINSGEDDVRSVAKVIRRGTYWAIGPEIAEFENKIAKFVGVKYALAFNSGTSALHSLLLAYGIKEGDEVIVPSFTFVATANSVLMVGAKPIFAEIEDKTYGLDPVDVEKRITKKTKAIMPIHYAGSACMNIAELRKIADRHKLFLFEDAAQSLGARIGDKMVGSFGDAAIFSMCQDKMVPTGEGGLVVTNSRDVYEKLKLIRSHGRAESTDYFSSTECFDYITLGFNFRMPSVIAALALSQFKKIQKNISGRQRNAKYYTSKLSKIKGITVPLVQNNFFHVYQKYTIQVENGLRDQLKDYLSKKGVFSKVYFTPLHLTKFYRKEFGYKEGYLPKTEEISKRVLTIPMFPTMKRQEMELVVKSIEDFFKRKNG